jgi:hypothetical protein
MDRRQKLTNEIVTKKFQNQFDLVNYAISIAAEIIHSGRATNADSWTENPALQALDEIATGHDKLGAFIEEEEEEEEDDVIEEAVVPKKRLPKKTEKALTE